MPCFALISHKVCRCTHTAPSRVDAFVEIQRQPNDRLSLRKIYLLLNGTVRKAMILPSRLRYLLVALGVGIGLLSIGFGGATQRACPGIDSIVYEVIRVHPSGVKITNIGFTTATIEWYDGCNWRTQSLVPVALGFLVSLVGFLIRSCVTIFSGVRDDR